MTRLRAVVAVPSLRWIVLAWGLSVVAETAALVVLLVVAYEVGGPALVAGFAVVRAVPALIVAPVVIGWSDRGRRERWLLAVLAARAVLLALAAGLLVADLAVAGLLLGGVAALLFSTHRPMNGALLPHVATTPGQLTAANAASSFAESAGTLVGPLLAGLLLVIGPPPVTLVVAAVLVAGSATAVGLIRDVAPSVDAGGAMTLTSAFSELASGMRALDQYRPIIVLVGTQTFGRGVLLVSVVVLAVDVFDQGDPGVGWLTAMLGVGGLVGSTVAAAVITSRRITRALVTGVALWGLPMVAIGVLTFPTVGYLGLVVIGIGNAVLDVGAFTLVARVTPPGMLGRVFAALEVVIVTGVTVGSLVAGAAVPAVGVELALAITGGMLVVLVAVHTSWARRTDAALAPDERAVALRACEALRTLPVATVDHLAAVGTEMVYDDGEDVMVQGEPGSDFHVVMDGQAVVRRDGRRIAVLDRGSGFGEIALLRRVPRTATVTADGPLRTFAVSRLDFTTFVAGHSAAAAAVANLAQERAPRR